MGLEKINKKNFFLGIDLEEMLFAYYLKKSTSDSKEYGIKKYLKYLLRTILGTIRNFFLKSDIVYSEKQKEKYHKKIFFILTFTNPKEKNQNKINEILEKLILEFKKEEIVLLVFKEDAYKKYKEENYNVLWIKPSKKTVNLKFLELKDLLFRKLDEKIFRLSECVEIIEAGDKLFKELVPKLIITTQDCYFEDYIFTRLAQKYKIKTITHLHGLILKTEKDLGGYIYYYSDYIMLWGKRDVELLHKYLPNKKLIVVGNSKFKNLLENRKKEKKYLVLCMTDLSFNQLKESKIINSFISIETKYEKIIKIHPAMNKKNFIKKYKKILENVKVEKEYKFIEEAKYLITYRTTAIIDGLCCGASILDIYTEEEEKDGELLKGLEESIVLIKELNSEIKKREEEKEYFNGLMVKQEKVLKRIIYSFESEKIEKKIIKRLLEE